MEISVVTARGIITELINEHRLECGVEANDSLKRAMEYKPGNKHIFYNLRLIIEYAEYFQVPLKATIQIMACHELGHYIDFSKSPDKLKKLHGLKRADYTRDDLIDLRDEIIGNEHSAWEFGKILVPANLRKWYDDLNKRNINNYQARFANFLK